MCELSWVNARATTRAGVEPGGVVVAGGGGEGGAARGRLGCCYRVQRVVRLRRRDRIVSEAGEGRARALGEVRRCATRGVSTLTESP